MSAGSGIRFFLNNNTQADPGVAVPPSAPDHPGRDVRALFSISSAPETLPGKSIEPLFLTAP